MSAKDVFGMIVRVVGLGLCGYGLRYIMSWLYVAVRHNAPQGWTGVDYLLLGVVYLAIGLFCLRGSRYVVGFAYPEGRTEKGEPGQKAV